MQPTDPAFEALADLMISRTSSMPLDETGRIVLPALLREAVGIEGEAIFVGRIRTFQIWKPETYETEEESWQQELPDDVDPLSFLDGDMEV